MNVKDASFGVLAGIAILGSLWLASVKETGFAKDLKIYTDREMDNRFTSIDFELVWKYARAKPDGSHCITLEPYQVIQYYTNAKEPLSSIAKLMIRPESLCPSKRAKSKAKK